MYVQIEPHGTCVYMCGRLGFGEEKSHTHMFNSEDIGGHSRLVFPLCWVTSISHLTNMKHHLWIISYSADKYAEMTLVWLRGPQTHIHTNNKSCQTSSYLSWFLRLCQNLSHSQHPLGLPALFFFIWFPNPRLAQHMPNDLRCGLGDLGWPTLLAGTVNATSAFVRGVFSL